MKRMQNMFQQTPLKIIIAPFYINNAPSLMLLEHHGTGLSMGNNISSLEA